MSEARALVLHPGDNVAVALVEVAAGQPVQAGERRLLAAEPIQPAHKLALREIAAGEEIVKYGSPIGRAKEPIASGAHVHVHNVESVRMRGDL